MYKKHGIIMVTLDCLRPDHLGFNGYKGVNTPNIDQLSKEGLFFRQAIAQAPNTWVSHASIFTGCNPYKHGVRSPYTRLSSKVKTIAEVLKDSGFSTAGFPAHTLLGSSLGLNRGFQEFNVPREDFRHSSTSEGHLFFRSWSSMWKRGKEWIYNQINSSNPFFIWFHYMGTHWEPPDNITLPQFYKQSFSSYGQYYDGKISFADKECVGNIINFLKNNNAYDNTTIVLFSDHGDKLRLNDPPYSYGGHNQNLIDEVMKIALIIKERGHSKRNIQIKEQVKAIDIMPTVLSIEKIPISSHIEGNDLMPLVSRQSIQKERTNLAYMENIPRGWIGIRSEEWKLILTSNQKKKCKDRKGEILIIREAVIKLLSEIKGNRDKINIFIFFLFYFTSIPLIILNRIFYFISTIKNSKTKNKKEEFISSEPIKIERSIVKKGKVFGLFNLKTDSHEHIDVAKEYPKIVEKLRSAITNMLKDGVKEINEIDNGEKEEITEKLEGLGYL